MGMKTFHSLHFPQFHLQSQHKLPFQCQQVCVHTLLQLHFSWSDLDYLHSLELWRNLRCLLWSSFRAPAHLNQSGVLEGMFACDGAPTVHARLGHGVVFVCLFFLLGESRHVLTLCKAQRLHSSITQLVLTETWVTELTLSLLQLHTARKS